MSKKYNKVMRYYNEGLWSQKQVQDAVKKNWITEEEYEMITGEPFEYI